MISLDQSVPRYTSYPTAPHFKPLDTRDLYPSWLSSIPSNSSLSLYIHIPFCSKLCWYCGCNTKITQRYKPIKDYLTLLLQEIHLLTQNLDDGKTIKHIHFGGGSPGIVEANDFERIINALRAHFNITPSTEIAIELDPREITQERVASYAKNGVNRVSLGVQDFNDQTLASVNREQPFQLSLEAVNLLRAHGIEKINFDLLYGLPHQTLQTMENTIEKALSLTPDRIAFFGYAHVPWVKKHMRLVDESSLPNTDLRFDLFETGAHLLQDNGYEAIGIDHFARQSDPLFKAMQSGQLKRNFQGYTTDKSDILIGLGASSIGQLPQGYIQNAPDIPTYKEHISNKQLPACKYYSLTQDDQMRAHVIEQLMCHLTVNLSEICKDFNQPITYFTQDIERLKQYEAMDFITITSNHNQIRVTINPKARSIMRIICSVFDAHLKLSPSRPQHAKAI